GQHLVGLGPDDARSGGARRVDQRRPERLDDGHRRRHELGQRALALVGERSETEVLGMKVAFVFPGQGSQSVGMGQALAQAFPEARAALDEADAALGFPLSKLMADGPDEELRKTANTQPAILAVSVAAYRAFL